MQAEPSLLRRLFSRLVKYSGVGFGTFLLDLAIVALLAYSVGIPYPYAVAVGFFIGISTNYLISYIWVFRGTTRNKYAGYAIFLAIAIAGIILITASTAFLVEMLAIPLLIARIMVAGIIGLMNFLLNTFFNFKVL